MQANKLISKEIQVHRAKVEEAVKDLHELAILTGNDELALTVSELRNRIHDPFMFVIVGEVKAGKSSFINALLDAGKEVAKVAPQPMTDTIQQLLYAEQEEVVQVNQWLKKIFLPANILREIAIVDTPGTNTIIERHQEITESFIPASDLVVFVFEAKNPYRQSAWDFFRYIHQDWHKKVIFVLQQKDLMDAADLEVNLQGVVATAHKQGIPHPVVFAVSAKAEQEGRREESGFEPLRNYIRTHITGGKAPLLKLRNSIGTAQNLLARIANGIALRKKQWTADQAFREDIRLSLTQQEAKSHRQVDTLVENLLAGYDRITHQKYEVLSNGLSFLALLKRSFAGLFSRKTSPKEWLHAFAGSLEQELNAEMQRKLNDSVADLADSIQQMVKITDLKIRHSQTALQQDQELFHNMAERRNNVYRELQDTFAHFLEQSDNFVQRDLFSNANTSISPNIAGGSSLAVVGIILAAVTQGMVFDITGGVLSTIGLLLAGVTAGIKRKRILNEFETEVHKGRSLLSSEVSEKLKAYVTRLKGRIDDNFIRFDQLLDSEGAQLTRLEEWQARIAGQLEALAREME